MIFTSIQFCFFFLIVLVCYYLLPNKIKPIFLVIVSYLFYMFQGAMYILLLLFVTLSTYNFALLFERTQKYRKALLIIGIVSNFSILFFFKYFNFFVASLNKILLKFNFETISITNEFALPIGISFYMFQAVGYLVDVYCTKTKAEKNLINYSLFVSFFPLVLSGPIERSTNLLKQIPQRKEFRIENIKNGVLVMSYGFFIKLVIADRIAIFVNSVYSNYEVYQGIVLLLAAVLYSIQIYCDFCGYSLIAAGVSETLGFHVINNFNQPYLSVSVQDFWKRWHISLSTWFRDYVYIPLGGSRCGNLKRYRNLMITFLISGLWHGANYTYIFWGGLNGLLQIIEQCLGKLRLFSIKNKEYSYNLLRRTINFLVMTFTWVFFRADSLDMALGIVRNIFKGCNMWVIFDGTLLKFGLLFTDWIILILGIIILFWFDVKHENGYHIRQMLYRQDIWFRWIIYVGITMAILLFGVYGPQFSATDFIYFQY